MYTPRYDYDSSIDELCSTNLYLQGCLELLDRYNIPVTGKKAVVLGRSNIVGLPMFMLLMQRNATVTICHSRTENLEDEIRQADILVRGPTRESSSRFEMNYESFSPSRLQQWASLSLFEENGLNQVSANLID